MNEFDTCKPVIDEPANFGKYGSLRLRYLKESKPTLYQALLREHKLNRHLNETDRLAQAMRNQLVQQLAQNEQIGESVKVSNPLLWVAKMNAFKIIAEEIIFQDLLYQ